MNNTGESIMPFEKQALYEAIKACALEAQLLLDEPMSRHTTMRVGGNADLLLLPSKAEHVRDAIKVCKTYGAPYVYMGNGSNMIVRDGGLRGLVIKMNETFSGCRFKGARVEVQSGVRLIALARDAIQKGLSGIEFAGGIPGTVGGAVAMNAGAYGDEMRKVVTAVTIIDEQLNIRRHILAPGDMGYRNTVFSQKGYIITGAELLLGFDSDGSARQRYDDYNRLRREKQPLSYPSAGSFFKRPEGYYAGKLIEEARLKGERVGDAEVSSLHAGFLINTGNASAADVLALCALVQKRVFEQFGVQLEPEVHIVGSDSDERKKNQPSVTK